MFVYTKHVLNLIKTFKIIIYNEKKNAYNTQTHFLRKSYFQGLDIHSKQRFPLFVYGQAGNYMFNCVRCFFSKLFLDII